MDRVKKLLVRAAGFYAEAYTAPPDRKVHLIALAQEYLKRAEERSAQRGKIADLIEEGHDIDKDVFPLRRYQL